MRLTIFHSILLAGLFFLNACDDQQIFEKNIDFKSYEWTSNDTLQFEVDIEDEEPKNVYVNLRHRYAFNWRNVWLNLEVQFPNDSLYKAAINMPLSQPDGQWYGDCSGDVCLVQLPLKSFTNFVFPYTGKYVFILNHEMREDPLLSVMSAGIRVENSLKE